MIIKYNHSFCGPEGLSLKFVLGPRAVKNVFVWFGATGSIYYTHKARTAIRYACKLLGLDSNSEILIPSYNCGSELDPLAQSGAHLVPYRVDKNCMIDLADAQHKVTKKTKAIYVTHYFGFPQSLQELKQFCKINKLYLLEDCALSLFSSLDDVKLGNTGDVAFFSFVKTLSTLDGGALIVNNPQLSTASWKLTNVSLTRLVRRSLSLFKSGLLRWSPLLTEIYFLYLKFRSKKEFSGINNSPKKNTSALPRIPDEYYFDENLADKSMSMMTKRMLARFDVEEIINRRRANYTNLLNLLSRNSKINIPFKNLPSGICPLSFPIIIDKREEVCAMLSNLAIDATAWWAGYYKDLEWEKYPDACYLKNNLLTLPIHQDLSKADINWMAKKLISIIERI